jgi:hypothetical protein
MRTSPRLGISIHIIAWVLVVGFFVFVYTHLRGPEVFEEKTLTLIPAIIALSTMIFLYFQIVPNTLVVVDEAGVRQLTFPRHVISWDQVTAVKLYSFSAEICANKKKIIIYLVLFDDYPRVVQLVKRHIPPSMS